MIAASRVALMIAPWLSATTPTSIMNSISGTTTPCRTAGLPASVPNTMRTPARAARSRPS